MRIQFGMWARDRETLDSVLTQLGIFGHPDLELAGAGYAGWSGKIMQATADKDENGQPVMLPLPGVYVNAIAHDWPREQTGRKSLARNLRHQVNPDRSEVKIEQEKAPGVRKTLMERTRFAAMAGKTPVASKGVTFDGKMPGGRIELEEGGEVIFAAFSMDPDDENRPATPACEWA